MMTQKQLSVTIIHADELTVGDVIRHFTGDLWQVATEPKYTRAGMKFKVHDLSVNSTETAEGSEPQALAVTARERFTQTVTFHPDWRFELVSHGSRSLMETTKTALPHQSMEVAA